MSLKGMSGGPVFRIPMNNEKPDLSKIKLVGIINKYWNCNNGFINATKIDGLLQALPKYLSDPTPSIKPQSKIKPYEMILLE